MGKNTAFTLWLTGMSGAGKTSIARVLESHFLEQGIPVEVLDGEVLRKKLSNHLGFSKQDRDYHVRQLGFVSNLLSRNGVIAIVAAISPYKMTRDEVRSWHGDRFVEVFVDCPLQTLIERDPRGLYRRALAGEITNFTGISDPYECPSTPEITVHTNRESLEESTRSLLAWLVEHEYLPPFLDPDGS